jgi:hypothetical protein
VSYDRQMAGVEHVVPDAPGCPLLGLAADPRSHFTYPHPGHRCFAKNLPAATDASRQATYCLSFDFAACDRYPRLESPAESGRRGQSQANGGQIGLVDDRERRDR